ncbi:P-factor pheromone Map2 [Schizosaccharomyces japonicus yFS275]|uniref:p-factor pheromone Map2 n=1 Tax=Schizosaccharomyces japonicus (strain yFS275 / FY16936) TaxID=402676 RepID=B6JWK4_SCHJY|nr:P-factor pheromone Map2 [Schizosaccharomyces japonicus yFS275]EEB05755.1 P-factor pheromone Map2 [Schizosaccharomyces japonicus yFS275]
MKFSAIFILSLFASAFAAPVPSSDAVEAAAPIIPELLSTEQVVLEGRVSDRVKQMLSHWWNFRNPDTANLKRSEPERRVSDRVKQMLSHWWNFRNPDTANLKRSEPERRVSDRVKQMLSHWWNFRNPDTANLKRSEPERRVSDRVKQMLSHWWNFRNPDTANLKKRALTDAQEEEAESEMDLLSYLLYSNDTSIAASGLNATEMVETILKDYE